MSKANAKSPAQDERRRTRRRPVLDSFSLFGVVPKKGVHRLPVHDLSDDGIGFDFDIEGESLADVPLSIGESLNIHLYLNQSLYLPLSIRVMRIEEKGTVRHVGAEFTQKSDPGYKGFQSFLQMLDTLAETGQISSP